LTDPTSTTLPAGRHDLPREFVITSQRDRLLDAMAESCARKRYAEVSVADVVATARVSRSTFYEIFPDKESCFLAAYDAILGRFITEVIKACRDPALTWPEQIELGLEASLDFLAAEPSFARMCIVDMFSAGPAALERYLSAVRLISAFVDSGRSRMPDREGVPKSIGTMAVSGAAVVIRAEIVADRTQEVPRVGPDILYTLLVPYMDREEALDRSERYGERLAARADA